MMMTTLTPHPAVDITTLSFAPCIIVHSQMKVLSALPLRNQGHEQVTFLVGMHIANR